MSTQIADGPRAASPTQQRSIRQDASLLFDMTAVTALLLGHVPLVLTYFRRLMLFEHYEFVPLLTIGVLGLFVSRVRRLPSDEVLAGLHAGVPVGRLLIGSATLVLASLICSPWLAMISLIICLGLILQSLAGGHGKELLPVWALTWLMIRPPLHLDLALIKRLQLETSRVASTALEHMGVMHLMEGNVLVVPQRRFLVEEACSGIHSVFALLTAAAFYAVWMRTPLLRGVLLMFSSVFWACFLNLVRIAATIIAFENFEIDLSAGWTHSATGMVTFFVAVFFLALTDQMLRFFLEPIDPHKVTYWEQEANPFVRRWNGTKSRRRAVPENTRPTAAGMRSRSLLGKVVSVVVAGLAAIAVVWQVNALKSETLDLNSPAVIAELTPESLPRELGDWVQVDYTLQHREADPVLSDVSQVWSYRGASHGALVSIDYPFRGWHQLSSCYQAQGWEIDSYTSVPLADTHGRSLSEVRMHRPTGERGLLLFVVMDANGRPLRDPAVESVWMQTIGRALERVQRPLASGFPELAPNSGVTTQMQLLISSGGDMIPPSVAEEAHGHFSTLHSHLAGLLNRHRHASMTGETP